MSAAVERSGMFASVGIEEARERVPRPVFESMLLLRHAGRVDMAMKRFEAWCGSVEGPLPLDGTALWLNSWLAMYDVTVRRGRRPGNRSQSGCGRRPRRATRRW